MPVASWLRTYRVSWFRWDVTAGVTTAAVVIPQAMAYATIAGLPVEFGLYTALIPMIVYSLLGSTRCLSVSTTSTIALLTASGIALAPEGAEPAVVAAVLAGEVGLLLVIAGLLRLGFLSSFISRPILAGFKIGMGLTVAASQLGKIMGVSISGETFFPKVASAASQVGDTNFWTLAIALTSFAALLFIKRRLPNLPGPLLVFVAGMALMAISQLEARGVATVADVPGGLPQLEIPDLALVTTLLPAAAGIALMAFVESIASARAFRTRDDLRVDPNRELLALGGANLAGGLFQAIPAGGGLSQTAVNDRAGARSQVSGLVTASSVALVLLFLASLFVYVPEPILGAIVLVAALGLIDIGGLRRISSLRFEEYVFGVIAALGVLALGALPGLLVGVVVSLVTLFWNLNHPPIFVLGRKPDTDVFRELGRDPADIVYKDLMIARIEAGLYFGNSQRVTDRLAKMVEEAPHRPRTLLLDLSAVPQIDSTAVEVFDDLAERLQSEGTEVWLAAMTTSVLEVAKAAPRWDDLKARRLIFPTLSEGVDAHGSESAPSDNRSASPW
ncbi:MAG: SulP family inorganic anion transporter [Actinomycetota bacterium]